MFHSCHHRLFTINHPYHFSCLNSRTVDDLMEYGRAVEDLREYSRAVEDLREYSRAVEQQERVLAWGSQQASSLFYSRILHAVYLCQCCVSHKCVSAMSHTNVSVSHTQQILSISQTLRQRWVRCPAVHCWRFLHGVDAYKHRCHTEKHLKSTKPL